MALPDCKPEYGNEDIPNVGTVRMRALTKGEIEDFVADMDSDSPDDAKEGAVLKILELSIDEDPKDIEAWLEEMASYKAEAVIKYVLAFSRGGPEVARALGN